MGICPTNDELLDFVDGRLPGPDASALRAHVDACPACRSLVAELTRDPADGVATRFRTVELLGRGATADVFRAIDQRDGRTVALKLLKPMFADDADVRARFYREARAAMVLKHPNITEVIDTGEIAGQPFIAMAFCDGGTLRQRLAQGRLAVGDALRWLVELADGIAAAHDKGIVHRDLKPSNLFITSDGVLKILDFGAAKLTAIATGEGSLTATGALLGTLAYMAPEQLRASAIDARADLWAIGVVAYEMLSGISPFAAERAEGTMVRVLQGQLRGLRQLRDDVPRALDKIILGRLLQRERERRFASARALAAALRRISVPAPRAAPSRSVARTPLVSLKPAGSRSRQWALLLLLAVAGAVAAGGWRASVRANWRPRVRDVLREELEHVTDVAISRDGRRLAFDMRRNGAQRVWIANRDGSQLRAVTGDGYSSPQLSRDGDALFVQRAQGGVFRLDLASGALTPMHPAITSPPTDCGPGGLVWVDPMSGRVMRQQRDGTIAELVPADEAHSYFSELSCDEDGRRLLYAAGRSEERDLEVWMVHVADGRRERLLDGSANVFAARFSGPGAMVFAQGTLDQSHLWEATLDGKKRRQLTFGGEREDTARLAGAGRTLLFASSHVVGAVFATSDRPPLRQLGFELGQIGHLVATPGDRALVLERLRQGRYQATRLALDSGEETLLADGARPIQILGDELVYARAADGDELEIRAVPLTGGPARLLWSVHGDSPYVDADGWLHYRARGGCRPWTAMRCRSGGAPEPEAPAPWQRVLPAPSGGWRAALRADPPTVGLFAPGASLAAPPTAELAIDDAAAHPVAWSRDGRSLLYVARGTPELRKRQVETGEDTIVLSAGAIDAFAVAGDGKTIFHVENQQRVRLESIDNFDTRPSL